MGEGDAGIVLRRLHYHLTRGLEGIHTTEEPTELRDFKDELVEELYDNKGERRKVDSGHEALQVLADPVKGKKGEGRESSTL
jgi:hypothetical protein